MIEKRANCVNKSCKRSFTYDAENLKGSSYPFCSPLCKGADLAGWVTEEYSLPSLPDIRGLEVDDEEELEA